MQTSRAQYLYSSSADSLADKQTVFIPDQTQVDSLNPQKPLWIPVIESIGLNLALGGFNAYVMNSEFAKINIKTVEHNFETGWTTDADGFITNMWAHPFHGSIYYNLARSSGYSYWTSMGVAALGSWQWEFFMENEPPAFNDWIMTSTGGSMIGEMFYRFSNLILDETARGSERFWRELGAGVFNPGRLFTRLVNGRTSRINPYQIYEKRPMVGEMALGSNNVADGTNFKDGKKNMMFTLEYAYGQPFYAKKFKPFDFFRFNLAVNFANQPPIGQFRLYGSLYGQSKRVGDNDRFLWGIFQHFDYMENNVYQIGGTSVGLGAGYRTSEKKSTQFIGLVHAAALLMGGANSDYATDYKVSFLDSARTYNMGPGGHAKMEAMVRFDFGTFYLGYSFWWIHTWVGAPGDEFIGMWSPKFRVHLGGRWFLGLEYLLYHRRGVYDDYDDRSMQNNEQRLFIGYSL
ncbi:MAG: DUF3943 domain-containing protein [Calditrichales bacterium]|nr:MAG: DUF3943 domain-containing protein [Calditrichales bacterium]